VRSRSLARKTLQPGRRSDGGGFDKKETLGRRKSVQQEATQTNMGKKRMVSGREREVKTNGSRRRKASTLESVYRGGREGGGIGSKFSRRKLAEII